MCHTKTCTGEQVQEAIQNGGGTFNDEYGNWFHDAVMEEQVYDPAEGPLGAYAPTPEDDEMMCEE